MYPYVYPYRIFLHILVVSPLKTVVKLARVITDKNVCISK
jgi:hypothetical protein